MHTKIPFFIAAVFFGASAHCADFVPSIENQKNLLAEIADSITLKGVDCCASGDDIATKIALIRSVDNPSASGEPSLSGKSLKYKLARIAKLIKLKLGDNTDISPKDYPLKISQISLDFVRVDLTGTFSHYEITSDCLVAFYDGINNTGTGAHSFSADTWKDLSGNGNDLTLTGTKSWNNDGFVFSGTTTFSRPAANMAGLPIGNSKYTIEVVFNPANVTNMGGGILGYGRNNATNMTNNFRFNGARNKFRHYWWSNDYDFSVPSVGNELQTVSITYDGGGGGLGHRQGYLNGSSDGVLQISSAYSNSNMNVSAEGNFWVGKTTNNEYAYGNQLNSIRIYNCDLTPAQILNNANYDQARYIAPPVVKVGDYDCVNLDIKSTTSAECWIFSGVQPGAYPIVIDGVGTGQTFVVQ
ncbi:MAG: LamG domain-containing protein [Rickettsiales bacterium]|jgi:hypothetical protein|nr:LamG domain-containing protein [Rickettsiales bacterium]